MCIRIVCQYLHEGTYVCILACICVQMCMQIYKYICGHEYMSVYAYINIACAHGRYACRSLYIYVYKYLFSYVYIFVYMYVYVVFFLLNECHQYCTKEKCL